jgi:mediator of RNA polymerase II transcription subunit 5
MRKELKDVLANFVPLIIQSSPQAARALEIFRTQTILAIEPFDKKERATDKEIEEILEDNMVVENMVVADMPTMNTRAGLYVYLNSLVSSPPDSRRTYSDSIVACWETIDRRPCYLFVSE